MFRILLLCMLPLQALAGTIDEPDTLITLDEVQVSTSRHQVFDAGHQLIKIGSQALNAHRHLSVDHLLSRHAGIFIKSYGPGNLSATSLRGGTAAQTALVWNGFHIQNPMHGQTDLSLIPVFFTDRVSVQYGGGSALWGSGSMGGVIHFQNERVSGQGVHTSFGLSGSNTGEFMQQLAVGAGIGRLSTRLRVFNLEAENRYQFIHSGFAHQPVMKQKHAGTRQQGILHEIHYQPHQKHHIDLRWWWQDNARHIPPAMMQTHQGGYQEDASLRVTGHWSYAGKHGVMNWRGAYFNEEVSYADSLTPESNSTAETLSQEAEYMFSPAPGFTGNPGIHFQRVRAWSDEYSGRREEFTYAVFMALKWDMIPGATQFHVNARQEFASGQALPFAPSVGMSLKMVSGMYLKINAGKNYRIPSLNDRYWVPGGNPDLKPEKGWSQDIGINFLRNSSVNTLNHVRFSLTGFHRKIDDWIMWVPVQGSMHWSPENIMQVRSYGTEARLQGQLEKGQAVLNWQMLWDHTKAVNTVAKSPNDASRGKQLIYVPENQMGINLNVQFRHLGISVNQSYTGRRYTTTDNSQWLGSFHHTDVSCFWKPASYSFHAFVSAHNVFNQAYQVMSGRPMPLRHFRAGAGYSFTLNSPKQHQSP